MVFLLHHSHLLFEKLCGYLVKKGIVVVLIVAIITNVMGDERTYDYAVALRAVNTIDFMTAEAANVPFDVLQKVMSRIINEVSGVNRVMYDLTSKPPGTIEME